MLYCLSHMKSHLNEAYLLSKCPMSTNTCYLVLRDVEERGRDIEGCIKQWFTFVKPNFEHYVEPQRKVAGKDAARCIFVGLTFGRCDCAQGSRE